VVVFHEQVSLPGTPGRAADSCSRPTLREKPMSAESNPHSGAENLQFDRAIDPASADNAGTPVCTKCNTPIRMYYYDVDGATTCSSCKQAVDRVHGTGAGRSGPGMMKAFLFGLGAALAGAVIYYSVMKYLELEIGYVAILIGFMVGYAIRSAVAGRGGRRFQLLAAGLTYFAVALAYTPFSIDGMREAALERAADSTSVSPDDDAVASADASTDAAADADETDAASADAVKLGPAAAALAVGGGLLFILILPIVVILGSMPSGLISALIIGLGMHTAWTMTRALDVTITGPFKVGDERARAAA
jgi:hypothetical protein